MPGYHDRVRMYGIRFIASYLPITKLYGLTGTQRISTSTNYTLITRILIYNRGSKEMFTHSAELKVLRIFNCSGRDYKNVLQLMAVMYTTISV